MLNWLFLQLYQLYYIIPSLIASFAFPLIDALLNVGQTIQWAYNEALNYAGWVLTQAWTWVNQKLAEAKAYANAVINGALAYAKNLFDQVWNYATTLVNNARAYVDSVIVALKAEAYRLLAEARAFVAFWSGKIDGLWNWFTSKAAYVIDRLLGLANFITPSTLASLVDLTTRLYRELVSFFSNPVGYILALLRGVFLDWLFFLIAYALGTENAELPPFPTYRSGGAGGAIWTGTPVVGDTSSLVAPLVRLFVTGYEFSAMHPGVDFGLISGDPVYAAHAGRVVISGFDLTGYGESIVLEGGGWRTRYAHLQERLVATNDTVSAGAQIATGDSTGNSSGPHLHFEIYYNNVAVDPLLVLPLT